MINVGYFLLSCLVLIDRDAEAVKLIDAEPTTQRKKDLSKWKATDMGSILDDSHVC